MTGEPCSIEIFYGNAPNSSRYWGRSLLLQRDRDAALQGTAHCAGQLQYLPGLLRRDRQGRSVLQRGQECGDFLLKHICLRDRQDGSCAPQGYQSRLSLAENSWRFLLEPDW